MRDIKSFVYRAGRISKRQKSALESDLEKYLLPKTDTYWNLNNYFSNNNDTVVEIGFGMGDSLITTALRYPDINFIGVEVFPPGIGHLVSSIEDNAIKNIRIANFDAVEVFQKNIASESLAGVQIFFPDPWHKKRHNKRRLIQPNFVKQLINTLKPAGFIHCATDWEDYALHMKNVLDNEDLLVVSDNGKSSIVRPETKFERRGQKLGHKITDLIYLKYN